ncbi:MAG: PaaI family thioesterase [Bacteroidota bacterium]
MHKLNSNRLIELYVEHNYYGKMTGMHFEILAPGIVNYTMPIGASVLATPYTAHGGAIAGLCDATVGVGALSLVVENLLIVSTVEMKVNFLLPARKDDVLTATSKVVKAGKRIIFMEAVVCNQNNELVATANATMNAYPAQKAGY